MVAELFMNKRIGGFGFYHYCGVILWILFSTRLYGQSAVLFDISSEITTNYIWRGIEFERRPVFSPGLGLKSGGFEAKIYGLLPFSSEPTNSAIFSSGYTWKTPYGLFFLGITDFYLPLGKMSLWKFTNDGTGAHTIEARAAYTMSNTPLKLTFIQSIYNDPQYSTYTELSYFSTFGEYELTFFAGYLFTPCSLWYSSGYVEPSSKAGLNNLVFFITKKLLPSPTWTIPIRGGIILSPLRGGAYLVFGCALW